MLFSTGRFIGLHQSCRTVPLKYMLDCHPSTVTVAMKSTLINNSQVGNLIAKFCDTYPNTTKVLPLKEKIMSSSCVCFISPNSEIKIKRSTDFLYEI